MDRSLFERDSDCQCWPGTTVPASSIATVEHLGGHLKNWREIKREIRGIVGGSTTWST